MSVPERPASIFQLPCTLSAKSFGKRPQPQAMRWQVNIAYHAQSSVPTYYKLLQLKSRLRLWRPNASTTDTNPEDKRRNVLQDVRRRKRRSNTSLDPA